MKLKGTTQCTYLYNPMIEHDKAWSVVKGSLVPRPLPDCISLLWRKISFSPQLRDKIWEWLGDEAIVQRHIYNCHSLNLAEWVPILMDATCILNVLECRSCTMFVAFLTPKIQSVILHVHVRTVYAGLWFLNYLLTIRDR